MNTLRTLVLFFLLAQRAIAQLESPAPWTAFSSLVNRETSTIGTANPANIPPDCNGAAGPTQVVTVANTLIKVHLKDGTPVASFGLQNWWRSVLTPINGSTPRFSPPTDAFDPVLGYDTLVGRWYFVISAARESRTSRLILAISSTSDFLTSSWLVYELPAPNTVGGFGPAYWYDQSTLGWSGDMIVLTVTSFFNSGLTGGNLFSTNSVIAIPKAEALAGRFSSSRFTVGHPISDLSFIAAARSYDAGVNIAYLVTNYDPEDGEYRISRLYRHTNGSIRFESGYYYPTSEAGQHEEDGPDEEILGGRGDAQQRGTPVRLNYGDGRIRSAVFQNGKIYATHHAFIPEDFDSFVGGVPLSEVNSSALWIKIDAATGHFDIMAGIGTLGSVTGGGTTASARNWLGHPSIAVNEANDVFVGFSISTSQMFLSSGYFMLKHDDPPSGRRGRIYMPGTGVIIDLDPSRRNRTGDYSGTCIDPDGVSFWTMQEYSATSPGGPSTWGAAWAHVGPPGATPPSTVVPEMTSSASILTDVISYLDFEVTTSSPAVVNVAGPLPSGFIFSSITNRLTGVSSRMGTYTIPVTMTNSAGVGTATITLEVGLTNLSRHLDCEPVGVLSVEPAPGAWGPVNAPHINAHDEIDAAAVFGVPDGQGRTMEMEVTGPASMSFWWKCKTEEGHDFLRVLVDGVRRAAISGEVPWQRRIIDIPAGTHIVHFTFQKDASRGVPEEHCLVDEVRIAPVVPPLVLGAVGIGAVAGQTLSYIPEIAGSASEANTTFSLVGTLPAGLSFDPATGGISGTPTDPGISAVNIRATNPAGITNSVVTISVTTEPLAVALNIPTATVTSGSEHRWYSQQAVSFDGISAARSGNIPNGAASKMSLPVNGPGTVNFRWRTICAPHDAALYVLLDGTEISRISGDSDWQRGRVNFSAGFHTVEWFYEKASRRAVGQDAGFVDDVELHTTPAPVFVDGTIFTGTVGIPLSYAPVIEGSVTSLKTVGALPPGLSLSGGVITGTPKNGGDFEVTIEAENSAGSTKQTYSVFIDGRGIGNALDQRNLEFSSSAPWTVELGTSVDGDSSAKSPPTANGASNYIETTVNGPARLSFWWSVSSEENYDFLSFQIDGKNEGAISGEKDWTRRTFYLEPGAHVLRWTYSKDPIISAGSDIGRVDNIRLDPLAEPMIENPCAMLAAKGVPVSWPLRSSDAQSFNIVGTLPSGLSYDAPSRSITGTASVATGASVTIEAINAAATTTAPLEIVNVSEPLVDGADAALLWSTGGDAPWFVEHCYTFDGVDALQTAALPEIGGVSNLEAIVSGPAQVDFRWAVSTGKNGGELAVFIDGVRQAAISRLVSWRAQSIIVPAGTHTVRWTYSRLDAGVYRADCGWLDKVMVTPLGTAPAITSAGSATATTEAAFSHQLATSPANATRFSLTGNLPPGVELNAVTGLISGTPYTAGTYFVNVTAENLSGPGASAPLAITVHTPFTLWAAGQGLPGDGEPFTDSDSDGVVNLLEFAVGGLAYGADGPAARPQFSVLGESVVLDFSRDPSATDLVYEVETTTNLQTWDIVAKSGAGLPTEGTGGGVAITESPSGGRINVRVEVPTGTGPSRFMRLRVSK